MTGPEVIECDRDDERCREQRQQLIGDDPDISLGLDVAEDDHELVASEARDRVGSRATCS